MNLLLRVLENIAAIESRQDESRCIGVLEKVMLFPETSQAALTTADATFLRELQKFGWDDVVRWIESWIAPYRQSMGELARVAESARKLEKTARNVARWNDRLRGLILPDLWRGKFGNLKILSAFSSAVDATYRIDNRGWASVIAHAAGFAKRPEDDLLREAYQIYQDDPLKDRAEVATVCEALAEVLFAYRNPRANLKPTLVPNSQAEQWVRQLHIDWVANPQVTLAGGGASLNIADALAGLGFASHTFWPYHGELLARAAVACSEPGELRRCWFDDKWAWRVGDFRDEGGATDGTGHSHPVRLSFIFSFAASSPPIRIPGIPEPVTPCGDARVIFQFKGYRATEFFANPAGKPGKWRSPLHFCRWRWNGAEKVKSANNRAVNSIRDAGYHRLILSAFQRADPKVIEELGGQCHGMRIHHEISGAFEGRPEVEKYCEALRQIYSGAAARTAGMNDGELAAFTAWDGTKVFAAAPPAGKDSFLQCLFRAIRVREFLNLDWLYVHGNDIDIAVVAPDKDEGYLMALRDAMLLSKVVVCAALHVRSGIATVPAGFEPCCSPKGFLALYRFASEFAKQYAASDRERDEIQQRILADGYTCAGGIVPGVIVVPVYWPDPQKGCSMTGAGDISSGVTAALGP